MATEEPAAKKTQSPWSPWHSRRAKPLSPTVEAITVESGSDGGEEGSSQLDVPELTLEEDNRAELPGDRPGGSGEGSAVSASPQAPPTGSAQGAVGEGRLALGRPAQAPSADGATGAPVTTATAPPAISMAAEGRSLAVATTHLPGLGASSSSSHGGLSEGYAIFDQARQVVNQMEKALATCQEDLRAREEMVAQSEVAFRENVRQTAERLNTREAEIAVEAQQLSRRREELRTTEERLTAERLSLAIREAEVEECHQKQLAAQAQVLRDELKLEFDGALASRAEEYGAALAKQEEATKVLRDELSQALDSSAKLSAANQQLEENATAAIAREAALQAQLQTSQEALSRRDAKVKELIKEHAKARHDVEEAIKAHQATLWVQRRDTAALQRVVDMAAAAMEEVGLNSDEWCKNLE